MSIERYLPGEEPQACEDEPPSAVKCLVTPKARGAKSAKAVAAAAEPTVSPATAPEKINRFPQSQSTRDFRRRHFPGISSSDWNNWHWQLQNTLRGVDAINRIIPLSPGEYEAMSRIEGGLPASITPYYASLIDASNPADPIRRSMIPSLDELVVSPGEAADPLAEDGQSPVPGLVHRYPDRVLFMTTEYCSAYCRYCTRSRLVGQVERRHYCREQWEKAIAYIAATPAVRDVVLSGGDPLTLSDEPLEWLLQKLRAIPHVEVIRLGTKTPAVLPMRITPALVKILRRYHPLWASIHFTHPRELTVETAEACSRLADAGLPLGSQTVLLKGVNDDVPTMRALMTGLMKNRVRPYYIYQCDPILGSAHFRTPVEKGIEIIKGLRGHVSGYAVPQFVIDAPGGGGKIPILPEYMTGRDENGVVLRNYKGGTYHYPDA